MYTKILETLKVKPTLYEESEGAIWTNAYISSQMLKAHLAPDTDGASRRHSFIEESARWIKDVVGGTNQKSLIDLGCGPGIYTELFDDMGFVVVGIDFSKHSIEYAKRSATAKGKKIEYIWQDYRKLNLSNQFDVATLIYCDFGVMKPSDRANVLKNVYGALKPGGILIIDVWTMKQYEDFIEEQSVSFEDYGFWSVAPYVCIKRKFRYDDSKTFLEQYLVITENESTCYNVWNCAFDKESLEKELEIAGFDTMHFYGDISGKPVTQTDNAICVVARRKG